MVNNNRGSAFVEIYVDKSMKLMEKLVENWAYQQCFSNNDMNSAPKQGGLINIKAMEPEFLMDLVERGIKNLGQVMLELMKILNLLFKDCKLNHQFNRLKMILNLFALFSHLMII